MTGKELIEIIKNNNLENCNFMLGVQGYTETHDIYVEIREIGKVIFDTVLDNKLSDDIPEINEFYNLAPYYKLFD